MAQNLLSRRKALQLFSSAPLLPLGTAMSATGLLAACGGSDDPAPVASKNYVSATFTGQEHVTPPTVVRTPGSEQLAAGAGDAAPRSRSKRARSAIAMPYFSFSRGAGGRS